MNIAVLGAECTGKTSLVQSLVLALSTPTVAAVCVPEALRIWCDQHGRTPRQDEQFEIAQAQGLRSQWAPAGATLVSDTAALMTAVYSDVLFQDQSLYASALDDLRQYDLTLVTGLDLPWVADGLQRDGPAVRAEVDNRLREFLDTHQVPYCLVYGRGSERLASAWRAVSHYQTGPNTTEP